MPLAALSCSLLREESWILLARLTLFSRTLTMMVVIIQLMSRKDVKRRNLLVRLGN